MARIPKITSFLLIIMGFQLHANAQNAYEELALFFSETQPRGTARLQGLGGASAALGADLGSIYNNPAGIALFQRSSISVSPALNINRSNTSYKNSTSRNTPVRSLKGNFNFSNLGFVYSDMLDANIDSDWRGGAFAITMQRTNHFHQKFAYEGNTNETSILDYYLEQANGVPIANIEEEVYNDNVSLISDEAMAYEAFLIDYNFDDDYYYSLPGFPPVIQSETVTFSGAQYQWNIAGGANYKDKLYLGGNIGIPRIRYEVNRTYTEEVTANNNPLNSLTLTDDYSVSGTGINLNLGIIYRPVSNLRFGVSYRTPTYYGLYESLEESIVANYNNYEYNEDITLNREESSKDEQSFSFNMVTPSNVTAGAAYFFGKKGFISGEIDATNYAGAFLTSSEYNFNDENRNIGNNYNTVINMRLGAELRLQEFRIRGGAARYAYGPDPANNNKAEFQFSGGIGFHLPDFFIDIALVSTRYSRIYNPYQLDVGVTPQVQANFSATHVVTSAGVYF